MKKIGAWVLYTVLRLLMFAVPLAVLFLVLPQQYWIYSTIAAALIGFALSYLILGRPRRVVAEQLASIGKKGPAAPKPGGDEDAEDSAVDASQPAASTPGVRRPEGDPVEQSDKPAEL